MCGICGELTFDGAPVSAATIVAMRDRLEHRGPDDHGLFVSDDRRAGLGFRRLAIIDVSPLGNQPMANEDGSVRVAFNGTWPRAACAAAAGTRCRPRRGKR